MQVGDIKNTQETYVFGATLAVRSERSKAAADLNSFTSYSLWNSLYLPEIAKGNTMCVVIQ